MSATATARLWDAFNGRELVRKKHEYPRVMAAFSPDGGFFVTTSHDGDPWTSRSCPVFVWESVSGRELRRLPGHRGEIGCIAVSPDGRRIITGSVDRTAKVWDIATRRCLATLTGHRSTVIGVAFTPDGRRIITTGFDYATRLWDSATFQELLNLKDHLFLAISPDGQRMVSGGAQLAKVLEIPSKNQSEKWLREDEGTSPSETR